MKPPEAASHSVALMTGMSAVSRSTVTMTRYAPNNSHTDADVDHQSCKAPQYNGRCYTNPSKHHLLSVYQLSVTITDFGYWRWPADIEDILSLSQGASWYIKDVVRWVIIYGWNQYL